MATWPEVSRSGCGAPPADSGATSAREGLQPFQLLIDWQAMLRDQLRLADAGADRYGRWRSGEHGRVAAARGQGGRSGRSVGRLGARRPAASTTRLTEEPLSDPAAPSPRRLDRLAGGAGALPRGPVDALPADPDPGSVERRPPLHHHGPDRRVADAPSARRGGSCAPREDLAGGSCAGPVVDTAFTPPRHPSIMALPHAREA